MTEYKQRDNSAAFGVFAGILVSHVVCTIFIILRVVSRLCCLRKWFVDDTLMMLAWLWSTGVCTVYILAMRLPQPVGSHRSLGGPMVSSWILGCLGLSFYQMTLCFAKLSIASFYLRIFRTRPTLTALNWTTMGVVMGLAVPLTVMGALQCRPGFGTSGTDGLGCFSFTPLLILSSATHAATDVWLIVLVVPTVSRLALPWRRRIPLVAILSLGVFAIAASIVRLRLSLSHDVQLTVGAPSTATLAFYALTVLECDLSILCATMPMIRPVLAWAWPQHFTEPLLRSNTASFDLTVISYHGYPWQSFTPLRGRRSRNATTLFASGNSAPGEEPRQSRPNLVDAHRAPTPLSLKTIITGGRGTQARRMTGPDTHPMLTSPTGDATTGEPRYSDGFRQWETPDLRAPDAGGGTALWDWTARAVVPRHQLRLSQESFMGPSDPASPHTLNSAASLRFSRDRVASRWQSMDLGSRAPSSRTEEDRPVTRA